MTTQKQRNHEEARATLLEYLAPGDTVYTVLRHVSKSGMSRSIDLYKMTGGGPLFLTYWTAKLLDEHVDQTNGGIKVGGCGMDMGFALVYKLSSVLFRDGFDCIGKDCPSNDHTNDYVSWTASEADRYSPTRRHTEGGYALRQRWL